MTHSWRTHKSHLVCPVLHKHCSEIQRKCSHILLPYSLLLVEGQFEEGSHTGQTESFTRGVKRGREFNKVVQVQVYTKSDVLECMLRWALTPPPPPPSNWIYNLFSKSWLWIALSFLSNYIFNGNLNWVNPLKMFLIIHLFSFESANLRDYTSICF